MGVGEDELGSGKIGIKQAVCPAGTIPMVAIEEHRDRMEGVIPQMQRQAREYGKTIRLVRYVAVEEVVTLTPEQSPPVTPRRYFTEGVARALIGRRVQARVALSRHWLRDLGLWIGSGSRGTVTQFAFGPEPDEFLVGIHWDDPRPSIPRRATYPIDRYTEDEYRALLGVPVEGEYPSASGAGRPQGCAA